MNFSQHILLKELLNLIFSTGKIENIKTSFVQTKAILNGKYELARDVDQKDLETIIALKHGYEYLINHNNTKINLEEIEKINNLVAVSDNNIQNSYRGKVRTKKEKDIHVNLDNGDYYIPLLLSRQQIEKDLYSIINYSKDNINDVNKAVLLMLYIIKNQLFMDGNKRTAILVANYYLVINDLGILRIPKNKMTTFFNKLCQYYKNEKLRIPFMNWIIDYCFISKNNFYNKNNHLIIKDNQDDKQRLINAYQACSEFKDIIKINLNNCCSYFLAEQGAILLDLSEFKRNLYFFNQFDNANGKLIYASDKNSSLKDLSVNLLILAKQYGFPEKVMQQFVNHLRLNRK